MAANLTLPFSASYLFGACPVPRQASTVVKMPAPLSMALAGTAKPKPAAATPAVLMSACGAGLKKTLSMAEEGGGAKEKPAKLKPAPATPAVPKAPRGAGLKKPMDISPALQHFLGTPQASRADTMKLVWDYIKKHNLQASHDKRVIVCDENLKSVLGKDQCNFLEIAKLLNPHFVKST